MSCNENKMAMDQVAAAGGMIEIEIDLNYVAYERFDNGDYDKYSLQADRKLTNQGNVFGEKFGKLNSMLNTDSTKISMDRFEENSTLKQLEPKTPLCECDFCGEIFPEKLDLINHIRHHEAKKSKITPYFKCLHCPKVVRCKQAPIEIKSDIGRYQCHDCDQIFKCLFHLAKHSRFLHSSGTSEEQNTCLICNKTYKNKYLLNSHIKNIHFKDRYQCLKCDKSFSTKKCLRYHVINIHEENTLQYACHVCNKVFKIKDCLTRHLVLHSDFKCRYCSSGFKCEENLNRHMRKAHSIDWKCDSCRKIFKSKHVLKIHNKLVHCKSARRQCDFCSASLKTIISLRTHIKHFHSGRQWQCSMCNRVFLQRYTLVTHIVNDHCLTSKAEKMYRCNACLEVFEGRNDLRAHIEKKRCYQVIQENVSDGQEDDEDFQMLEPEVEITGD